MDPITRDVNALEAWAGVMTRARAELPDTTIVMWFSDVEPISLVHEVLTLSVPSALVRERLQHNHLSLVEEAAAETIGLVVVIGLGVPAGPRAGAAGPCAGRPRT